MELAVVEVKGVYAVTRRCEKLPRGMVGGTVRLIYSPMWNGLIKNVVFQGSGKTVTICDAGESVEIPPEVLSKTGSRVKIGIYGINAEETIAIPTLWAELNDISPAADPDADPAADPTLPIWAQLQEDVEKLKQSGGGGGNVDFRTDETLTLKNGVLSVNTTNDMEQDNTLPITSAGVFATVGNIEALLKTI